MWGSPAGAEVLLDGEVVGRLPMERPIRVVNSVVTLQVRAKGFATITRAVQVPRGENGAREQVDLHPQVAADAPPAHAVPGGPVAEESQPRSVDLSARPVASPDAEERPVYRKTWFWVVVSLGVVVAGGATAIALSRPRTEYPTPDSSSTFGAP